MIKQLETSADVTGPINLGNPREFTIRELAVQVLDKIGPKSELTESDLPSDDPKQRKPDITLATALGWQPKVELAEGLDRTIAYFRQKLSQTRLADNEIALQFSPKGRSRLVV